MEQGKVCLEKEKMAGEVCLWEESSLHVWGTLENQENQLQGRPSSEEPPVNVARIVGVAGAEDAVDIVGAAAKIPKIVHQKMWAMTQFILHLGL